MATCWYCDSFAENPSTECRFCGVAALGSKPKWVMVLDALPTPQDQTRSFVRWYVAWEIVLVTLGLMYWPWWAALGALFIGLFVAAPFALATSVLMEQAAQLWRSSRQKLLRASHQRGLFALEERTEARLRRDQEAFDTLISLIVRERRHRDLMPDAGMVEYRKHRVLPAFGKLVRLSVSALLEMEVRRLLNQCEHICDGARDCGHQELNLRYERLESMQRELGAIKKRWSEYILASVARPEFAVTAEPGGDEFEPQLPPTATVLAPEDTARLQSAKDTVRQLRQMLHQTQELQLLRAAQPLAGHEALPLGEASTAGSSMSILLRQIEAPDRLGELEREYQRIAAEQRVVHDTAAPPATPGLAAPEAGTINKPIDAPAILSNSLRLH